MWEGAASDGELAKAPERFASSLSNSNMRRLLSHSGGGNKQALLRDNLQRKRLIPHIIEQHNDFVTLVAHDQSLAPGGVAYTTVERERRGICPLMARPLFAIVTESAWLVQLLAEVVQQVLAPAIRGFGIALKHVQSRFYNLATIFMQFNYLAGQLRAVTEIT